MKVEQKFIVTINDSPFELSKQEAEALYYELQKELWNNPMTPTIEPFWVKDYDYRKTNSTPIPQWEIICSSGSVETVLDTIP